MLPLLEDVLAGGVAEALARTAAQLRDDGEALDAVAATCSPGLRRTETRKTAYPNAQLAVEEGALDAPSARGAEAARVLADAPAAVRRRALRAWLGARGVTGLTDLHLRAADDLVGRWRGQGAVMLPQRLELVREHGKLRVRTAAWPGAR